MLSTHNLAGQAHNGCLLEIAHRRVYHASVLTNKAVGSYPTISPLPTNSRRYPFCCTFRPFPSISGKKKPKHYLVRLSPSVRTFLPHPFWRKEKGDRSARVNFMEFSNPLTSRSISILWHNLCTL